MNGTKIEYTIDNFSELISVDDFVKLSPENVIKGVYFLYSKDKKLLYIGKSVNSIRQRLRYHLIIETPHPYDDRENEWILYKRKNYFYFAYTSVGVDFIDMVEQGLIAKYKPKFNVEFNYRKIRIT